MKKFLRNEIHSKFVDNSLILSVEYCKLDQIKKNFFKLDYEFKSQILDSI